MSDTEQEERQFEIEIARNGRAGCKKCKQKCLQGDVRVAKIVANPFGDGKMKNWHHLDCLFEAFKKQRATTKRIESEDDIIGFELLPSDEQNLIKEKIQESRKFFGMPNKVSPKPKKNKKKETQDDNNKKVDSVKGDSDNQFKTFQHVIAQVSNHPSYLDKTAIVKNFFEKGSSGGGFKGDVEMWCRLLLPQSVKRIYNLQSKQLIKLFSRMFLEDQDEMLEHLELGDVSKTIAHFHQQSRKFQPLPKESTITIENVDNFLEHLSKLTKEDDQINHFDKILPKLTSEDLKTIIRLIKHDLRMGAGPKHILEGIHPDAFDVYKASKDIDDVIARCFGSKKIESAEIRLLTPVYPMLAEPCRSVDQAMQKCVNGMYSEIKYDGERVQVHKHGNEFKYFSRALKPVLPHKVAHFKEYIQKAFPHGHDLILDTEILMMDTNTGKPLPFGTLGVHKKAQFKNATVCLFVFDCIYYNGKSLMDQPLQERKRILQENMKEVPNHIVFSEMKEIDNKEKLTKMIAKVLKLGLEGLVLKDIMSIYEPGKRHWLKVKKDYLFGGAMADSADLIVLGAWYGTGRKGGMMSIFLMGCFDPYARQFCTVTKVHGGHDDKTLERLQKELKMEKISCDPEKVPSWLDCTKTMIPDFVAEDPKMMPVWEITGAEFTQQHDVHTANGISIRFPRVTKIRDDKDWKSATNLQELNVLFKKSKEDTDVSLLLKGIKRKSNDEDENCESLGSTNSIGSTGESSATHDSPNKRKKQNKDKLSYSFENKSKKEKYNKGVKKGQSSDSGVGKHVSDKIIINPLPNLFQGIKACFADTTNSDIERYFIAYGGIAIKADNKNAATYIFHYRTKLDKLPDDVPKTTRNLHISWIVDSVNAMKLQDTNKYMVKWILQSNDSEDEAFKNY